MVRAFASFTEAAGSLERTYGQLQGQVAHLRQELEVTNRDLEISLEENHRIRERLRCILEGLPCGVLVVERDREFLRSTQRRRVCWGAVSSSVDALPAELHAALERARRTGEEAELQSSYALREPPDRENSGSNRLNRSSLSSRSSQPVPVWVAIRHAWLERSAAHATSVFIVRDISEARNSSKIASN